MKNKAAKSASVWTLVGAWAVVGWGSPAWAQFKCGNVFVAEAPHACQGGILPPYDTDLIWELDTRTREARIFAFVPYELCGHITGLAFTPDGTRLRASSYYRSEIIEFDSKGNLTTALGPADGIACPSGRNNLAYDAQGNFYVANGCGSKILRFPADGGPGTVFTSGTGALIAIAFVPDGDLYFTSILNNSGRLMRVTPDGTATEFDNYGTTTHGITLTNDRRGYIYVGLRNRQILRYRAGDPASKTVLVPAGPWATIYSIAMSADQSLLYVHSYHKAYAIDVLSGSYTTLVEFFTPMREGFTGGIAVAPSMPCVSMASAWSLNALALVMFAAGTAAILWHMRSSRAVPGGPVRIV